MLAEPKSLSTQKYIFFWTAILSQLKSFSVIWIILISLQEQPFGIKEDLINFHIERSFFFLLFFFHAADRKHRNCHVLAQNFSKTHFGIRFQYHRGLFYIWGSKSDCMHHRVTNSSTGAHNEPSLRPRSEEMKCSSLWLPREPGFFFLSVLCIAVLGRQTTPGFLQTLYNRITEEGRTHPVSEKLCCQILFWPTYK